MNGPCETLYTARAMKAEDPYVMQVSLAQVDGEGRGEVQERMAGIPSSISHCINFIDYGTVFISEYANYFLTSLQKYTVECFLYPNDLEHILLLKVCLFISSVL